MIINIILYKNTKHLTIILDICSLLEYPKPCKPHRGRTKLWSVSI